MLFQQDQHRSLIEAIVQRNSARAEASPRTTPALIRGSLRSGRRACAPWCGLPLPTRKGGAGPSEIEGLEVCRCAASARSDMASAYQFARRCPRRKVKSFALASHSMRALIPSRDDVLAYKIY